MKETIKIAIPMAGLGTRLRPHTWSKPKPLVQVAGKTVLAHLLDSLKTLPDPAQIELVFIIGYLGDQVPEYMAKYYPDIKAHYVVQEKMLGQSQALWLAREYLHGPMMVVFADTIAETDFSIIGKTDLDGIAWVKSVPDPRRFGVAEVNAEGYVTRMVEKPTEMDNNRVVIGLYYFKNATDIMSAIEKQIASGKTFKGEYFLTESINVMLETGARMRTQEVGSWLDAGTSEALLETNKHLLAAGVSQSPAFRAEDKVTIIPPVNIHPSVKISNSTIGPNASIAQDCVIDGSFLRDSIVDESSRIERSTLHDSLLGRKTQVFGMEGQLDIGDNSRIMIKGEK